MTYRTTSAQETVATCLISTSLLLTLSALFPHEWEQDKPFSQHASVQFWGSKLQLSSWNCPMGTDLSQFKQ